MSQEETPKSAQPVSTSQSEQLAAVDAEFNEELDDSQLEAVTGGADSNDSKQRQIEDISKWGG